MGVRELAFFGQRLQTLTDGIKTSTSLSLYLSLFVLSWIEIDCGRELESERERVREKENLKESNSKIK